MSSRVLPAAAVFAVSAGLALSFTTPATAFTQGDRLHSRVAAPQLAHQSTTAGRGAAATPQGVPKGTCFTQRDNDNGTGIISQNFESDFDIYDSQGADDFTLSKPCTVTEILVDGLYFNGSGPAASLHVTFYADNSGTPGAVISDQDNLSYTDLASGTFDAALESVPLDPGTYWVSVQVNMDFNIGGEWGWNTNVKQRGYPADWQNPGDGFSTGCTTWQVMSTCIAAGQGPDFSFSLLGISGNKVTLVNLTKISPKSFLAAGNAACPNTDWYRYAGGKNDTYAGSADYAYPSPNLVTLMQNSIQGIVDYDVPVNNGRFGDSFNLQNTRSVCYAVIQFRAKWSPTGDIPQNDGLALGHVGSSGTFNTPLVAQVINAGVSPTGLNQTYALNATGLKLLSKQTGYYMTPNYDPDQSVLDVYLQDDTEIDYFQMYVWYGPNCKQAGHPYESC